MRAQVNRIIPASAVDGPGNRTAIFLQGCNYACGYCHNPETIRLCTHCGLCVGACPAGALALREGKVCYDASKCVFCDACIQRCEQLSSPRIRHLSAQETLAQIERFLPLVRGITVSGGECTLYRDYLVELFRLVKNAGKGTLIDSNGSYDFSLDPELLSAADGVMLDVKAWDSDEHLALTGCENATVRKNLRFLGAAGKLQEVRTVVAPGMFNAVETVAHVAAELAALSEPVTYKLIRFRPLGVREAFRHTGPPDTAQMRELQQMAQARGCVAEII